MADRSKAYTLPLLPLRAHPLRASTLVWAVDRYLFAYDTARSAWEQRRRELHTDVIRALDAAAVGEAVRWISSGDDKSVSVWSERPGSWEPAGTLNHTKKVTCAVLDPGGKAVFADKFGDVYWWGLEEHAEAKLLLSHLAIVTAMVFTSSGRFLVSADNHEKVRVSCYPHAEEIHSFCLGHAAQITALAPLRDDTVVSASVDGTLRLWGPDGELAASCELGAPVSSLSCSPGGVAVVGCEAAPKLRQVRFQEGGACAASEIEPSAPESPQAVHLCPEGGRVSWVDHRGHLRMAPDAAGGSWGDVFDGEDLPASLTCLSKNAWSDDAGGQKEPEDDDVPAQPRKRQPK